MRDMEPTSAVMYPSDGEREVSIPKMFVEMFDRNHIILIYEHKRKIIIVLPVDGIDVYMLHITMRTMSSSFIKALNILFKRVHLASNMIFTEGVCTDDAGCYYECYFYASKLTCTVDELRKDVSDIVDVSSVDIRPIRCI